MKANLSLARIKCQQTKVDFLEKSKITSREGLHIAVHFDKKRF
jgi:hypothetical protein